MCLQFLCVFSIISLRLRVWGGGGGLRENECVDEFTRACACVFVFGYVCVELCCHARARTGYVHKGMLFYVLRIITMPVTSILEK